MSLKDEVKKHYSIRLKKAIKANSKEEIELCEQILRQFSDYDIHSNGSGIFTDEVIKKLRTLIMDKWKGQGFPETSLVTMFLYGSWLRGTQTDKSALNVCIMYCKFDSNGKRMLKDSDYNDSLSINKDSVKTRFSTEKMSVELNGKNIELDLYFKELTNNIVDDYHSGPKLYLK